MVEMGGWLDMAKEVMGLQHEADPAQMVVPPGGVTGPNLPAPAMPQTDAAGKGVLGQTLGDFGSGLMQEGLGGLFDITGMLDRQEAQRELAGNFQIIDPANPPAKRAGNQISQEEFEKTARLYSDIRLDRTHMHFDLESGDAPITDDKKQDKYKRDFMGNVGRILQTEDGRQLIDGVANNEKGHDVNIRNNPNIDAQGADPTNLEDAANGKGSGGTVTVDPSRDGTAGGPGDAWRKMRSDVTLFHELAHTYHQVRGDEDHSGNVGPGLNGSDRDQIMYGPDMPLEERQKGSWEQQAVGIGHHEGDSITENSYRRQRAEIGATGKGAVAGDAGMPQRTDYSGPF